MDELAGVEESLYRVAISVGFCLSAQSLRKSQVVLLSNAAIFEIDAPKSNVFCR